MIFLLMNFVKFLNKLAKSFVAIILKFIQICNCTSLKFFECQENAKISPTLCYWLNFPFGFSAKVVCDCKAVLVFPEAIAHIPIVELVWSNFDIFLVLSKSSEWDVAFLLSENMNFKYILVCCYTYIRNAFKWNAEDVKIVLLISFK